MLVARRIVLGVTSFVFVAIALASLLMPQTMADPLGFKLDNVNAQNEFWAIYVGLWLAHAVVLGWAARRIELLILGDVAGILILGQVVGRIASLPVHGLPEADLWPAALAEIIGAGLILGLRPRGQANHEAPEAAAQPPK